ncbi:MAG: hypothetical protein B7Z08_03595 [Sphingomonadales bacterium 32-68-7]|nr:MAG: hypothetical protein B7Z33_05420 [Sphingomonadales bacterium 12-68-11]OYX09835.1 MAG: hypothetical protein B7Z08_03595 [Sphingomonadales bacterium 32-68-7]
MKLLDLAAATALALSTLAVPALAQSAGVAAGAKVYGPDGGEVGAIEKVDGDNVVVNTGNLTATLPASVFGAGEKGPTIGWNKADLEAAITAANEEAKAAFEAALVEGSDLYSSDGVLLGKIKSVAEDGSVVAELEAGPVTLKKEQMALSGDKLTFLATAADVRAATAQSGG